MSTGRHGDGTPLADIPGMPALIEKPNVHRQLVALCRENTPAAKVIIDIATGHGYKTRDRLFAAQLIIERGWGKAPMRSAAQRSGTKCLR
jgi:hypothetical protein